MKFIMLLVYQYHPENGFNIKATKDEEKYYLFINMIIHVFHQIMLNYSEITGIFLI